MYIIFKNIKYRDLKMVLTFTKYKEINSFGIQNILYFSIPLFFLHFTIYIFLLQV